MSDNLISRTSLGPKTPVVTNTFLVERMWKAYTLLYDLIIDTTNQAEAISVEQLSIDEQGGFIYLQEEGISSNNVRFLALNLLTGALQTTLTNVSLGTHGNWLYNLSRSAYGLFLCGLGATTGILYIVSNKKIVKQYTLSNFDMASNTDPLTAMSVTGQYVVVAGGDISNNNKLRVACFQGSV